MNTVSTPPWNQFDLCFCSGKESAGEILSVNYLFYGSQEYHTQQSVQLNRIFYESFLSFWAAWGNVCVSVCQGEQQQPFWYTGPQKTPESRVLCHQHADENKMGLNLGPDMASRPLHTLPNPNPHQSYIQQREFQHNQNHVCSRCLPLKFYLLLPHVIHVWTCYSLL